MKKLLQLSCLVLLCITYSCDTEPIISSQDDVSNFKTTNFENKSEEDPFSNITENDLQWVSYIVVETYNEHPQLRNNFESLITSDQTIKLNVLFNDNGFFINSFKEEFMINLIAQIGSGIGQPQDQADKPNFPITPSNSNINPDLPLSFEKQAENFMNYILHANCIEIYFPYSFNFDHGGFLHSTGHPLNADNDNEGFEHRANGSVVPVTITPFENNIENLAIARPYRTVGGKTNPCPYGEYNDLDFTEFFDN